MIGEKGKKPSVQWYYKDWISDRKLQMASPTSRGIWMNLLMYMIDCSLDGEDCEPGELTNLNSRQIASLGGCSEQEAHTFIEEALTHKFCDISVTSHGFVTIKSRRLKRDNERRVRWRDRQRKSRDRKSKEQPVTDASRKSHGVSPTPSPTLSKDKDKSIVPKRHNYPMWFESFWDKWPKHERKRGKWNAYQKLNRILKQNNTSPQDVIAGLKKWIASTAWSKDGGKWIPLPETWISGRMWMEEPEIGEGKQPWHI